jgi:hypothetical protein
MSSKLFAALAIMALIGLLSLSAATTTTTTANASSPAASYNERYQRMGVRYVASSSPAGSQILYQVLNVTSSGTAANHTETLTETNYAGVVAAGSTNVSISASSNYTAGTDSAQVTVSGGGGTLVFVSVVQSGETQIIWAGTVQLSPGTPDVFNGLAYVNDSESASVVVGFATANGTRDVNATLGTSANSTLSLPKITFSHTSSAKVNAQVNIIVPIRYASLTINGEATINASASIATPLLSAGISEFGNVTYPDLVWQGNVSSTISVDSTSWPATASARTAEFFGINGTLVGYVQIVNLASNHTLTVGGLSTKVQAYSSSTLLVWSTAPSSQTGDMTGVAGILVTIGGQPVVVRIGTSGQVQSSANVQREHQVTANGSSSYRLVLLNTTSTVRSYFLLGIVGNRATRVSAIVPAGERQTTITVNSTVYPATQVNFTATSGAVTFNVTSSYSRITVFKATALGVVELNSSNYWVVSGQVYVFDDPSSTYYVANAAAAGQTTTTGSSSSTSASVTTVSSTQTSSQSSGTLSTASSTSQGNTLSSAAGTSATSATSATVATSTVTTMTSTSPASTQSSASSSSSLGSYVVIAVLGVIVVCALLVLALRRTGGGARQTAV